MTTRRYWPEPGPGRALVRPVKRHAPEAVYCDILPGEDAKTAGTRGYYELVAAFDQVGLDAFGVKKKED